MNPLDQAKGYKSEISQISLECLSALSPKKTESPALLGCFGFIPFAPQPFAPTPGARYLHRARLKISVWGQPTTPSTWSGPVPGPPVCARNRGVFRTAVRQPSQSCRILSCPPPGHGQLSCCASPALPPNLQLPPSSLRLSAKRPVCFHSQLLCMSGLPPAARAYPFTVTASWGPTAPSKHFRDTKF